MTQPAVVNMSAHHFETLATDHLFNSPLVQVLKIKAVISAMVCGLLLVSGCTSLPVTTAVANASPAARLVALYTVQADGQRAVLRAITQQTTPPSSCPSVVWAGGPQQLMAVRALPANVPARGQAPYDSKAALFDVLTCEATWPAGVNSAQVAGQTLAAPKADIQRIVVIADTGCRMNGSENAFQDCNDPVAWPFAQVAQSAALTKPDLVIHIGDMHYRESPCPPGNVGCAGSPWGYGFDAWQADFFAPAKPLLAAAPWVFVRGNHEICARAGQGWFRFVDTQAWQAERSCNDPANDNDADFSNPYAVQITPDTQFIVFDSAKASGKPYTEKDAAFGKYKANLQLSDALSALKPHNFFMSHHPLLAVASGKKAQNPLPGGTVGLQSVFKTNHPLRLFAPQIDVAMHGHIHVFEALAFKSAHPTSLVLGNSGSANDGNLPTSVPAGFQAYPGAVVEDYVATASYGFATLDRQTGGPGQWLMTAFNVQGIPLFKCAITGSKSKCTKAGIAP